MTNYTYDPSTLAGMVREYLDDQRELKVFLATTPSINGFAEIRYNRLEQAANSAYGALMTVARMLSVDYPTLVATVKAMNRYERKHKWRKCARIPSGYDWRNRMDHQDRVRRFWAVPDWSIYYFESTGRRKPWVYDEEV